MPTEAVKQEAQTKSREYPPEMLSYLERVITQIEGRRVEREELLEIIARKMRQHSMEAEEKNDHIVTRLKKNSP